MRRSGFPRIDLSTIVLLLVLAFCGVLIHQFARAYPAANRGMLMFAQAQKDLFVDAGLVAQSYRVQANPDLARMLRSQTVIVGTTTSARRGYVGAGVIIGQYRGTLAIVTAKHVIAHHGRRFVVFRQFAGRFANRVVADRTHDLAVVFVKAPRGVAYSRARLAPTSFASGERFVVMGHPGARSWVASPGIAEKHAHTTLLFCPSCDRGDSGAGAFDGKGLLRGIVVAKATMIAPAASDGHDFRLTAFEIEQPEAIRALLARTLKH